MEIANASADNILEALGLPEEWLNDFTHALMKAENEIIDGGTEDLTEKSLVMRVNHLIDSPQKGYFVGRLIAKWYNEASDEVTDEAMVDAILGDPDQNPEE